MESFLSSLKITANTFRKLISHIFKNTPNAYTNSSGLLPKGESIGLSPFSKKGTIGLNSIKESREHKILMSLILQEKLL